MSVRVKICGVRQPEHARAATDAGADLIGLNFHPASKRFVDDAQAKAVAIAVPASVAKVGVFVNASRDRIHACIESLGLSAIQLHGDEGPEFCTGWESFGVSVIKAIRVADDTAIAAEARRFEGVRLLLDAAAGAEYGGSGRRFDWDRIDVDPGEILLAGGLNPENVADAVRRVRPWGVDVASGVESAPGQQDPQRIEEFVSNAKSA